jgi:hypothetical protein
LTVSILFNGCQSRLPKEVPSNLEIRYEDKTGEPTNWRIVTVSDKQMTVEMSCAEVRKVTLTDKELAIRYRRFVENEFDLIEDQSLSVNNDAKFREISLQAGSVMKKVRSGDQFPLSGKNDSRFRALWTAMREELVGDVGFCGDENKTNN